MGVLLKQVVPALVGLVLVGACAAPTFRMRVPEPVGGELRVLGGPFSGERALPIPFIATFEPMGDWQSYEVRLVVPRETAQRLGGRGETELPGQLHVYRATELARTSLAELPIDEGRLGGILRGELAEASWWVYDPNREDGRLARLTVRGAVR